MMKKYIIFLPLIVFLSSGCGDKLSTTTNDESQNLTTSLLAGTWTAKCSDNSTASTSTKSVLLFSDAADNLTASTTIYSDLKCVTQNYIIRKMLNTIALGSKDVTSLNQIITKYTSVITSITLEPQTLTSSTSLNSSSYCGLTGWSSGTETSIAGLTCGSITYKSQNAAYKDLIQINSEKTFIRLGNTNNLGSNGYPKTLYTEEYFK